MAYVDITDLIFSTWGLLNNGPHWGHIRATIDRIAADNTGHDRTAVCPTHRPDAGRRRRSPRPLGVL
jgi:hypothetical protein